jgi:hypothetical protein
MTLEETLARTEQDLRAIWEVFHGQVTKVLDLLGADEVWRGRSEASDTPNERDEEVHQSLPIFNVVFYRPLENAANALHLS